MEAVYCFYYPHSPHSPSSVLCTVQILCKKSAIDFVTDSSVVIVTLLFKYIKSTPELIFIILLRHMDLLEVMKLKYLFSFARCQALRRWFSRRLSLWFVLTQSYVLAASSCSTECSMLLEQTKAPRKWGLVPLMSQAVAVCLASCSPNSYSPCGALIPQAEQESGFWCSDCFP